MWLTKDISIAPKKRGFHLVTSEILSQCPEVKNIKTGLMHLFLMHTSASLTINENADPDVRRDFALWLRRNIKDREDYFSHILEGDDDMTAHIKSSLLGVSLSLPVKNGRLNLGTWQGIYLGEHRSYASERRITVTLHGEV